MLGLVELGLNNGGMIRTLLIPLNNLGPSLMNPTILNHNGQLLMNIRNVNYVFYHAEKNVNEHVWGPLNYLHPENDITLTTKNVFCVLDQDLQITDYSVTDFGLLDTPPVWNFVGLEDARLVYWNDKLYDCGVRRDTTTNGQGRMELSEILYSAGKSSEISRTRIPAPAPDTSYCEKNWMPILDQPYHWVKWTNPTEVVKYDTDNKVTETVLLKNPVGCDGCLDLRGSSQVIPYNGGYLAILHEVQFEVSEKGNKDGLYKHRFVFWDRSFNIISISPPFNFMGANVEFTCGMCEYGDDLIIPFGYQDNAAFVLRCPKTVVNNLL